MKMAVVVSAPVGWLSGSCSGIVSAACLYQYRGGKVPRRKSSTLRSQENSLSGGRDVAPERQFRGAIDPPPLMGKLVFRTLAVRRLYAPGEPMTSLDHSGLVELMKDPAFYPHDVQEVEYLQTHVSSVFLTGPLAYKLKKPVDFGFLDFTTVELRKNFCQKELELNRRLAPSVYLRVEPITVEDGHPVLGGPGPAVDWVVVMQQLDQRRLGPRVLERGELSVEMIESVVDVLVPFYRAAKTGPGVDEFGAMEVVKFNTDENFEQTEGYVGSAIPRGEYDDIMSATDRFYEEKGGIFHRRIEEGWTRECHGDLHLGNIFFETPPVIFDCIDFNERFRCSDVAVDLAFLVMDLDFQGVPDLARRVVEHYVDRAGDEGFLEMVDFYCCYRAYVRGKIACFTSSDPALSPAEQERQLGLAREYFHLAHRYATAGGHGRVLS